jgi:hypothetical protein
MVSPTLTSTTLTLTSIYLAKANFLVDYKGSVLIAPSPMSLIGLTAPL